MLTSFCSDIACQQMNVETCSKTCASFLPVYHQLKRLPHFVDVIYDVISHIANEFYTLVKLSTKCELLASMVKYNNNKNNNKIIMNFIYTQINESQGL